MTRSGVVLADLAKADRQALLLSFPMPVQSTAHNTMGLCFGTTITRPMASRGWMISVAGLTPPLQRGLPKGGVASARKVAILTGCSACRTRGKRRKIQN